jgi:hypothetical protein
MVPVLDFLEGGVELALELMVMRLPKISEILSAVRRHRPKQVEFAFDLSPLVRIGEGRFFLTIGFQAFANRQFARP